jgi:hypothetical protein
VLVLGSSHTFLDTWVATSMKAPVVPRSVGHHDVSKPTAAVTSWSAERMGPMIIAVPHRGHAHVARVGTSVSCGASAAVFAVDVDGVASKLRARVTRAVRQVFARNPDWRMRTKPRDRMCWTKRRRNSDGLDVFPSHGHHFVGRDNGGLPDSAW